jgi:5-methylcytosine-specific restriction protein A
VYFPQDPSHIKKEKQRAKDLKKTRWWREKLAAGLCHYCEQKFPMDELTMDHLIPIGRGGHSDKANVVVACKACNTKKGARLDIEFDKSKID